MVKKVRYICLAILTYIAIVMDRQMDKQNDHSMQLYGLLATLQSCHTPTGYSKTSTCPTQTFRKWRVKS